MRSMGRLGIEARWSNELEEIGLLPTMLCRGFKPKASTIFIQTPGGTMVGRTSSASPTMRVPRGTRGDVKMDRYSHTHTNTKSCVLSDLPCSALPGCLHPVCDDVHFRAKPHKHMRSNRVGRLCFGGCEAGLRRWACNTSNYM